MYSAVVADLRNPGVIGPCGLAREDKPLQFATSKCLPSGVTRTEVVYQPTGIKPSERLFPGALTSKTATLLLSAFATKRSESSGVRARLFGVEPGGASGYSEQVSVSTTRCSSVLITVTE